MAQTEEEYKERVRQFQAELNRPTLELVHKYILSGLPVLLSPNDYVELRFDVARHFHVCPTEVLLVGSCRTGFSLVDKTHKNEGPRYRSAHASSDLDLVVVSERLFTTIWDSVFDYAQRDRAYAGTDEGAKLREDLFNGWIDPRSMPPGRRFELKIRWTTFFDQMSSSRKYGQRRASARVYRDWQRLEVFQSIAVEQCRHESRSAPR